MSDSTDAKPAKAQPFSPWAYSERGLKAAVLEDLKTFKPEGNPDPKQLENVRALALQEIGDLDDQSNFVEVKIEAQSNPRARQSMVLLLPSTIHA